MCRENWWRENRRLARDGTSLRVQGELNWRKRERNAAGNIPACAGRTSRVYMLTISSTEHPCVCRENRLTGVRMRSGFGTSLRVQGELDDSDSATAINRNIPACAGRTEACGMMRGTLSEHPCVCRENSLGANPDAQTYGTSLRVQGEHPRASNS